MCSNGAGHFYRGECLVHRDIDTQDSSTADFKSRALHKGREESRDQGLAWPGCGHPWRLSTWWVPHRPHKCLLSPPRFSQMVQDKPLRTSWQRKMKERQERKLTKDFARHLEEEKERRRQVRSWTAGD